MTDDMVNHPRHYNAHPSGVECIDLIEWLTGNLFNTVKYLWRKDDKGAPTQDVEKALWYITREIQRRTQYPWTDVEVEVTSEILDLLQRWAKHEPAGWRKTAILTIFDGTLEELKIAQKLIAMAVQEGAE